MSEPVSVAHDFITCPICLDTFRNPRSLPCLHCFCLKCIQDYCKTKSGCQQDDIPCPICRKEFQIPSDGVIGLPHSFFIQGLIDGGHFTSRLSMGQFGELCNVCLKDKEESGVSSVPAATKYCVDCDQKLCERCSRPHRRASGGEHEVKALGPELEQELTQRGSFCDKHRNKRVELYCFTCQENICVLCSAVKHKKHEQGEISELIAEFKSRIHSDKDQVASHISEIRRKVKKVQDERNKLIRDIDTIGAESRAAGEEAKRVIDKQVLGRLSELESLKEKQMKLAVAVEDSLQLELAAAASFHRYSCELADKGRPSDITGGVTNLHAKAEEILRSRNVIFASYRAPYMTFTPADISQVDFVGQLQMSDYKEKERKKAGLVHTLPEGEAVVGVTLLGDNIYLARPNGGKDQVEVYDVVTFSLRRCLTVPNARAFADMTSCEHFLCLYISDAAVKCIHRLDVQGDTNNATRWPVDDVPFGLSVTSAHSLLVTCHVVRTIKEFASGGKLVRVIPLPDDVINPYHAVQVQNGQFVVCHGSFRDRVHRVVVTSADGQRIVHSHDGQKGSSGHLKYEVAYHLAVDDDESVFVVESNNRLVKMLSPTLNYVRQVVSCDYFKWCPDNLCLDVDRRRLYVTDNELRDDKLVAGRVVVFSV